MHAPVCEGWAELLPLNGKDMYTLTGHQPELDKFASQTVTVTGTLNGNTFTVDSVTPVKK